MDQIHDIKSKPWICQRTIRLRHVLQQRDEELQENRVSLAAAQQFDEYEKDLAASMESFVASNEEEVKPFFLFNSDDERTLVSEQECKLKMFLLQLEHARKMVSDRAYKVSYLMDLKTTRRELLMRHLASVNRTNSEIESQAIPTPSQIAAIVVVQIWPQPSKTAKVKLEKEILFRSDQCLTDLRDQFKCERDYSVPMDLSENPEQADRIFRGELFKSGFFLIGETFYNDMRDQNNIDLSASIVDWASKEVIVLREGMNMAVNRGLGPFNRLRMEECKFEDLTFKLGCPYLYLHQGDCEHLFTISEIRYVANDTQLRQTKFPFVTATAINRNMDNLRCYMCQSRPPHWYTRNNERLPLDPYFFCENCFYAFNYDSDKKKIGTFQAYLYTSALGIPESVIMAANK